jgi:hypothetical protein
VSRLTSIQDGVALDDFVDPARVPSSVEIDPPRILLDDRVLPDRRRREVVEYLAGVAGGQVEHQPAVRSAGESA